MRTSSDDDGLVSEILPAGRWQVRPARGTPFGYSEALAVDVPAFAVARLTVAAR